jgi:hypothetical protein
MLDFKQWPADLTEEEVLRILGLNRDEAHVPKPVKQSRGDRDFFKLLQHYKNTGWTLEGIADLTGRSEARIQCLFENAGEEPPLSRPNEERPYVSISEFKRLRNTR